MSPFVFQSLFWWGLPLVGLPILIHLINMMRHRRVHWAAMEFLLASQKRHRTWIILKQLLLLMLRMAAVAAIVAMVAQPLVRNRLGGVIGATKTHHIVLLDDSFSMSDRWTDSSAFDEARGAVARLGTKAVAEDAPQLFTLLRFSRATKSAGSMRQDLVQAPVDADFSRRLETTLAGLTPSYSAVGPLEALAAVEELPKRPGDEDRVVYIVSDFRAREWSEPTALRKAMARLESENTQLVLVNCVDAARPNLAITALRPGAGTRAAGVPLPIEISLHNYGQSLAREVSVTLEEDGVARPPVVFEAVPPGRTITRRFQSLPAAAGEHEIVARLPGDHVAADNSRCLVVNVPPAVPVLIVDGDPRTRDAYFVTSVLAPGGKTRTGLAPRVEPPKYLDDQPLDGFSVIYLLNVERLSTEAVTKLEDYVRAGGGLGFFVGERTRAEWVNQALYRDGEGLLPAPLGFATELLVNQADKTPDLVVTAHPIFAIFSGQRNGFLATVNVQRYFTLASDWNPKPDSSVKVIARLRNKAPLAIERSFGKGRVITMLTKASPATTERGPWNNWGSGNPSYVVALLEMQAYLSAARQTDSVRLVGAPLDVQLPLGKYQPDVRFFLPTDTGREALTVAAVESKSGMSARLFDVERSGIYEAQASAADGSTEVRKFAVNVSADEGNLATLDGPQISSRLGDLKFRYLAASALDIDARQLAGINLGPSLMYCLIGLLVGEQLLAYSLSYHPRKTGGARR